MASRKANSVMQIWVSKDIHGMYKKLADETNGKIRDYVEEALVGHMPVILDKAAEKAKTRKQFSKVFPDKEDENDAESTGS